MSYAASFDELRTKVDSAREEYVRALEAQREAMRLRTGIVVPDSTQHIHHIHETLRLALGNYQDAVAEFSDYVLQRTRRSPESVQQARQNSPMHVELLLIEDNEGDARLIQQITPECKAPVRIRTATSCAGALAVLADESFMPNLVIADLGVLEFGGVELMKRCMPRGIPVVVFTGSANPKGRAKVLQLGVKEFVEKPSTLDEYSNAVWKIISTWVTVPVSSSKAAAT